MKDNKIVFINEIIKKIAKDYGVFTFSLCLFGVIAYYVSISNQLTNNLDAFWHGMFYTTKSHELSEGRFMWCLLSPLFQGIQMDAYTSIIAFIFWALGLALIYSIIGLKSKPDLFFYIISFIFITEVGIRAQISYRFQAPFFGMAFFFCILGSWCAIKINNKCLSVVFGAVFLAIGMGFYQIDIGCAAIVLLIDLLVRMCKEKDYSSFWRQALKDLLSGGAGVFLYILVMKVTLVVSGVKLTGRVGASGMNGIIMIKSAPASVVRCYKTLFDYYFTNEFNKNVLQSRYHHFIYLVFFFIILVGIILTTYRLVAEKKYLFAVLFNILFVSLPIFANCSCFLGPDVSITIQMTITMGLILPLLLYYSFGNKNISNYIFKTLIFVFGIIILYGNFFSLQIDQQAMYEGKNAVESMSNQMIADLTQYGYFNVPSDERKPVVVLGSAEPNEQFVVSEKFYEANRYARMGDFMDDCVRISWEAAFRDYSCRNVDFINIDQYFDLVNNREQEFERMSMFPMDGYILELDDVVVINASMRFDN